MKIKSFFAYGRITVKFIPDDGKVFALCMKRKDLMLNSNIIMCTCQKDTREEYGAFLTIKWKAENNNDANTIQLTTTTETTTEDGRMLWEQLSTFGFLPSKETNKKIKK